jgi:predicted PhzF superfamily epimerase YddE/YHI9
VTHPLHIVDVFAEAPFTGNPLALRVGQGDEMRRPSTLYVRAERRNGTSRVQVGGRVVPTVDGTLR